MSDTDIEHSQHFNEPTATPKLYISDRTGETLDAIELTLEILPAFNLRSTEVVLVELLIDGIQRGQCLIEGSSPDRKATFTALDKYLRPGQCNVHETYLHITHGSLTRQGSSGPQSYTKVKGNTYKVLHKFIDHNSHETGSVDHVETSEHSKVDDTAHETSQESFHDARSEFENVPDKPTAEQEERTFEDVTAAGDESPVEDQYVPASSGTGSTANITTISTEDNLTRLDQAKRVIFKEDSQSNIEPTTIPSGFPRNESSPSVQDPDTEMFDDFASNTEQSGQTEIAPRQRKPMQTFGTISGHLSSNKSAAQLGINSDTADPNDEAVSLIPNPRPLTIRRTSHAVSGSFFQPDASDELEGSDETNKMSRTSKGSLISDEGNTQSTAPKSKIHRDSAAQKAARHKWETSGGRVNNELRKRLAENDEKIGDGRCTLKLWNGKNFGTDAARNAMNIRLGDLLKKQVKLHNLLVASTDANDAADLRQRLPPWSDGNVDEYESHLEAISSAVEQAPSTNLVATKQQAYSDPVEDSDDDIALPLLSSPQQRLAAALLSEDRPVRQTTEATAHVNRGYDQQVQIATSPIVNNETPEGSDDDELPDIDDFLSQRPPRGDFSKTQTAHDAGESLERPKKKLRTEF
jgi:hypothetical protein